MSAFNTITFNSVHLDAFNKTGNHITLIALCSFYMSKVTVRWHNHAKQLLLFIDLSHRNDDVELPISDIFTEVCAFCSLFNCSFFSSFLYIFRVLLRMMAAPLYHCLLSFFLLFFYSFNLLINVLVCVCRDLCLDIWWSCKRYNRHHGLDELFFHLFFIEGLMKLRCIESFTLKQ